MTVFDKFSDIDPIDQEILKLLAKDGRKTSQQLGDAVGLSASAAHRRVKMLEKGGLISGYRAIIKEQVWGRSTIVFVQATLQDQRRETFEAFEEMVRACPEIEECHLMSGEADYLLRIVLSDHADYETVHREVLSTMPGVSRLVSLFSIRTIKS